MEAPPVEAAGVFPRSLGRHSYVRLTEEQFRAARATIAGAIVGSGYDRMADQFAAWEAEVSGLTGPERAERLLDLLPPNPEVLELGIGAGVAQSQILAERGRLTGVDVSEEQLRRARKRLPVARLVHADMTAVDFDDASFDAVVSFYVLNHVPREELGPLIGRISRWLRPGGYFFAAFGTKDTPASQEEFLGVQMFFSGHEPPENERVIRDAGLEIVESEIETIVEPDYGEGDFHWVLAQKPG
jgi:cyclopropane fatty-acyl-phospholipid synthase-like methyltransferase